MIWLAYAWKLKVLIKISTQKYLNTNFIPISYLNCASYKKPFSLIPIMGKNFKKRVFGYVCAFYALTAFYFFHVATISIYPE